MQRQIEAKSTRLFRRPPPAREERQQTTLFGLKSGIERDLALLSIPRVPKSALVKVKKRVRNVNAPGTVPRILEPA